MKMNIFNKRVLNSSLNSYTLPPSLDLEGAKKQIQNIQHFLKNEAERTSERPIQGLFLQRIFEEVLGYSSQLSGESEYFLKVEPSTETDTTHPDGSLGYFGSENKTKAVIELKDANTSLDSKQYSKSLQVTPVEQGFNYSYRYNGCKWVIVSNFREIRLYSVEKGINYYESFDVLTLDQDEVFKKFYFLLNKQSLLSKNQVSNTENLLREAYIQEQDITKKFYDEYRDIRYKLLQHLINNNPSIDKNVLLEKTQKILDRIIFICFCEDLSLLPVNLLRRVTDNAKNSFDVSETKVWNETKNLFRSVNKGNYDMDINKFNGGLYADDEVLDNLIVKDSLFNEVLKISDYDFESELNVNILGHIFEQSISDLEEIKTEIIEGVETQNIGKRKSEGIYYTPEHITKFIVESAVGRWLNDKKFELGFNELPKLTEKDLSSVKLTAKKRQYNQNIKQHIEFWEKYKEKIQNIKVLDPACGSGAFLIQVFDFLYQEGQSVNKSLAELRGGQADIFALDKHILQNNIFGVDLNQESVEITKLSLWLKTANRQSELTTLDENIKCGNSLISDNTISDTKAFIWESEFREIFDKGGFDVIIGNPPYEVLSEKESGIKNIDRLLAYIRSDSILSEAIKGKNNLYKLFICKGISLVKENGYFSLIVPMALLGDNQALPVRRVLLEKTSLQNIECFPQKDDPKNRVFEEAKLSTCIFLTKKEISDSPFIIRTHPGKWIDISTENTLKISKDEIAKFDEENLTIPNCNHNDWEIVKKIISTNYFQKLGTFVKQYQGEINETNQRAENVLTSDSSYAQILRGSNITLYAVREASQGEDLFLNDSKYLQGKDDNSKAFHHNFKRIGFQRSSPQNNFRRIIASPIQKGQYCFDTVSYVTEESSKVDLDILLALLNSNLYDWYFRCFSTNSKINEYQFNMLPFFKVQDQIDNQIVNLLEQERYPEIINLISNSVKNDLVPSYVLETIKSLSIKIQAIEKARVLTSRTERSKLAPESAQLQRYLNTFLCSIFGLSNEEFEYIEKRRKEML